jgi:hypothetical protein
MNDRWDETYLTSQKEASGSFLSLATRSDGKPEEKKIKTNGQNMENRK